MSGATVPATPRDHHEAAAAWERAYLRFETPAEERRKFTRRLRLAGANGWRRDAVILDLFSGRGGGAEALRGLGLPGVISLDLSPRLLRHRHDASACSVADCRELPIATGSVDIVVVQGGLHHLARIPDDVSATLQEVARVLKPDGTFVVVEPWRTPFLDLVHWLCGLPMARRLHPKLGALAAMIELERPTYEAWLGKGEEILALFDRYFVDRQSRFRLGKLHYVGTPRSARV